MKQLIKIILLLIIFGGGGFLGFQYWKKMQEAKLNGTPPSATEANAPASLTPPKSPAGTEAANPSSAAQPPAASYDLTVQPDELSKAVATLTMEKGDIIKIRFYTNDAPNTVKRIAELIASGFYNGITVHRVEPGFVVQAGDPTGTGAGGSGVKLKAEFNKRKHEPGILSMARMPSDPDSADSQFFIMLGISNQLDGQYTIFGKVVEGFPSVQKIQRGDKIKSFTIQ